MPSVGELLKIPGSRPQATRKVTVCLVDFYDGPFGLTIIFLFRVGLFLNHFEAGRRV